MYFFISDFGIGGPVYGKGMKIGRTSKDFIQTFGCLVCAVETFQLIIAAFERKNGENFSKILTFFINSQLLTLLDFFMEDKTSKKSQWRILDILKLCQRPLMEFLKSSLFCKMAHQFHHFFAIFRLRNHHPRSRT